MKSIRERFMELLNGIIFGKGCTIHNHHNDEIIEIIRKEYFDNELDIKVTRDYYEIDSFDYRYFINEEEYESAEEYINKLQSLYDLRCIKRKIENI